MSLESTPMDTTPQKTIVEPLDEDGCRLKISDRVLVPTQSPMDKDRVEECTIEQSEEDYARELEAIQRKAEEELQRYVDQQLLLKKQEFERRTQAAAVKMAAEWKHDGLNIDDIIEINFREYAQQYEGLYTKALALKRTFEEGKSEFERQVRKTHKTVFVLMQRAAISCENIVFRCLSNTEKCTALAKTPGIAVMQSKRLSSKKKRTHWSARLSRRAWSTHASNPIACLLENSYQIANGIVSSSYCLFYTKAFCECMCCTKGRRFESHSKPH